MSMYNSFSYNPLMIIIEGIENFDLEGIIHHINKQWIGWKIVNPNNILGDARTYMTGFQGFDRKCDASAFAYEMNYNLIQYQTISGLYSSEILDMDKHIVMTSTSHVNSFVYGNNCGDSHRQREFMNNNNTSHSNNEYAKLHQIERYLNVGFDVHLLMFVGDDDFDYSKYISRFTGQRFSVDEVKELNDGYKRFLNQTSLSDDRIHRFDVGTNLEQVRQDSVNTINGIIRKFSQS